MIFDFTPQEAGLILAALEHTQHTAEEGVRNGVPGSASQAQRCAALITKIQQQATAHAPANAVPA